MAGSSGAIRSFFHTWALPGTLPRRYRIGACLMPASDPPCQSVPLRAAVAPHRAGRLRRMANFPTHIAVGTVVSGALATVTVAADMVAPENVVAVTLAGVLGSVLPDIDLEESRPARAMFSGLAIFFSFAVLFGLDRKYSILEMLILWLGTLFLVRFGVKEIFFRFSYHRGVWHSLLALVFCSLVTAVIFSRL